jgi:hypothetical protein
MRLSATRQTRRKTAQEQNTNGKHAECDHAKKKRQRTKKGSRILKHMKIKICEESYTLEDGHVG